ncbi:hypothetical protein ATANTOWER_027213 [Ataeniobius toweri]|uniref:Uncharacterized protein n=1 Tax=Ataeniobius toweri TaxID=208326 RepID=A0ABU7AZZ8_9TELE|nr:hypothetical protein [Ataeniobius toweri]
MRDSRTVSRPQTGACSAVPMERPDPLHHRKESSAQAQVEDQKDYMKKLEERLAQNNVQDVSRGLKNISEFGQSVRRTADGDQCWADELNYYFNRFSFPPTLSPPSPGDPSARSLHVFRVYTWVLSRYSGFLPQSITVM